MKSFPKKLSAFKDTYSTSLKLLALIWSISKVFFVGNLVAIGIPAVFPFINAYIYKLIIDLVVAGIASPSNFSYSLLYVYIGLRILMLFIQEVAFYFQTYFDQLLWNKMPINLYQKVLGKLSSLDLEYYEDSAFRDKLEKVREAYLWRPLNMSSSLFYFYQSILQLLIAFIAIATLNWVLMIVVILVAVPTFVNQTNYESKIWGIWNDTTSKRKRFNYIADLIQAGQSIKEIKMFQMAPRLLNELKNIHTSFAEKNIKTAHKQLKISSLLSVFTVAGYTGVEVFIIFSALAKKLTVGDIGYYTQVVYSFQNGINGAFRNAIQIFSQSLYVKEIFDLLNVESKIKKVESPTIIDFTKAPKIEFRNVSFIYPGTNDKIFNDFSIIINPGEKVAFVGENGAGKTTFVKLLARFYDVTEGAILLNNIDIKNVDLESWYKALGILFQDFVRYEYSLSDNIYFGKVYEDKDMKEIIKAAKNSGAADVADSLPGGYDQMLGRTFEEGLELSTGQWQKVALGRAFLRKSPILILDEPTASIDAKAEAEIFEKVEALSQDKTLLIISHRFSTVRNADKIYVIDRGKIKEFGSHDELMKKRGMYAELFEIQARGYK